MSELKSTRLQIVIEPSSVTKVDHWRRRQEDLPSRSEAIRRLIDLGLQSEPILIDILRLMESLEDEDGTLAAHIVKLRQMLRLR